MLRARFSYRLGVSIAITPVLMLTIPVADSLHSVTHGFDVERPGCANGHPSCVRARFLAAGNNRFHHIACLKALDGALLFCPGAWETVPVHPAHLAGLTSGGGDD